MDRWIPYLGANTGGGGGLICSVLMRENILEALCNSAVGIHLSLI